MPEVGVKTWEKVQKAAEKLVWHIPVDHDYYAMQAIVRAEGQKPFLTVCGLTYRYPTAKQFHHADESWDVPYCENCLSGNVP